jgi:hypothetical protein
MLQPAKSLAVHLRRRREASSDDSGNQVFQFCTPLTGKIVRACAPSPHSTRMGLAISAPAA